ncbi:MAG: AAA-like domain-containing protein [Cyanobacteria bacterium P01_F01_bin.143]
MYSHNQKLGSLPVNQTEFNTCLASLSKTQREVILLELKGLEVEQIAQARNCSSNVVYKRRAEAYRRFGIQNAPGSYFSDEHRQKILALFKQYASEELKQVIWVEQTELALKSDIYVARINEEQAMKKATEQTGSLVRLRGPKHVGKTLLHLRVLEQLPKQDYNRVALSFKWADRQTFEGLEGFLRWFCAVVSRELGLTNRVKDVWDDDLSHNYNATYYFETCILEALEIPLVLALDDMDLVFDHQDIADDFSKLLRSWHEQANKGTRSSQQWQKLRLWIIHSTEKYAAWDIHSSPLNNVGTVVSLIDFDVEQVEDLARQKQVEWASAQTTELIRLVGGHPALVQVTFDHLKHGTTFSEILKNACTESSIYTSYLREQLDILRRTPELAQEFKCIVESTDPIQVNTNASFQLQSMGLTLLMGNLSAPRNQLYRDYFCSRL